MHRGLGGAKGARRGDVQTLREEEQWLSHYHPKPGSRDGRDQCVLTLLSLFPHIHLRLVALDG